MIFAAGDVGQALGGDLAEPAGAAFDLGVDFVAGAPVDRMLASTPSTTSSMCASEDVAGFAVGDDAADDQSSVLAMVARSEPRLKKPPSKRPISGLGVGGQRDQRPWHAQRATRRGLRRGRGHAPVA